MKEAAASVVSSGLAVVSKGELDRETDEVLAEKQI